MILRRIFEKNYKKIIYWRHCYGYRIFNSNGFINNLNSWRNNKLSYTRKQDKIGLMFQNWQVYFEENKEKIREQEKITDNIFNKLNSIAGLIPYFNIILDDSKIKENDGKIYLGISLINIGKESATNVGICLTEERKEVIVEGYDKNQDGYIVYNYLDKYYSMVGDKINFSIVADRKEKIMNDLQYNIMI